MNESFITIRRVIGASAINIFYLVAQSLLFIIMTPWALKALGEDLFGIWIIFLAVMGFSSAANLKIISTVMKYTSQFSGDPEFSDNFSSVISFSYPFALILSGIISVVILVIRNWLAGSISVEVVGTATLASAFIPLSLSLIPLFLSEVSIGVLLGLVRNEISGGLVVFHHLLLWLGALAVGSFGGGPFHLAIVILAVNTSRFILTTIAVWAVTRECELSFSWNNLLIREMLGYTSIAWIGALGMLMFNSLDKVLVGMTLGVATAGTYGIASSLSLRLSMLADQITQVLVPFTSRYSAQGKRAEIRVIFRHASRLVACLMVAASGVLVIWMDYILSLWISPTFSYSYSYLFAYLIIIYALFSLFRPAHQIALGISLIKVPNLILIGSAAGMLVVLLPLSLNFGLRGAVLANTIFMLTISMNFYIAYKLELDPLRTVLLDIGPPLFLLAILSIPTFLYPSLPIYWRLILTITLVLGLVPMALNKDRRDSVRRIYFANSAVKEN